MPDVKFKMTTQNEKSLFDALTKSEKKADALQNKLDKTGKKGKKSFGSMKVGAKDFAIGLTGVATAAAVVVKSLTMIKDGWVAAQAAQEKFYNKNVTLSEAKAQALWNMPGTFEGGKQGLESLAKKIQKDTGSKLPNVYKILSAGFSAGGEGETLTSSAVNAAKLEKAGIGEGEQLVGAGLDLASVTGLSDAETNFGFLKQIGSASRVVDLKSQLNLAPALVAGTQSGDTAEQTGELLATISQIIKDKEGNITSTGGIGFMQTLASKAIIPTIEKTLNKKTGKISEKTTFGKLSGESTFERLEKLQEIFQGSNKDQQDLIMQQIGGEKKMQAFLKSALSNSELFQTTLAQSQAKITKPGEATKSEFQEFKANLETGSEGLAGVGKSGDAAIDLLQTVGKERSGAKGKVRDLVQQYLSGSDSVEAQVVSSFDKAGAGFIGSKIAGLGGLSEGDYYLKLLQSQVTEEDKGTDAYKALIEAINKLIEISKANKEATAPPAPSQQEVN